MPANYSRPEPTYVAVSRPNDQRYELLTENDQRPPTDKLIDLDYNYLIDVTNILDARIDGVAVGDLPGINDIINANKLLTTNGVGGVSWVFVSSSNILDSGITGIKIFPQAITQRELADGGIPTSKIQQKAITTGLLADECVTTDQLGEEAVTTDKIASGAVTYFEIADGTIRATELASNSVTTDKILDANVTTDKILDANITTDKILDANVTTSKIADAAITLPKMAPDVIKVAASKADQIAGASTNVYTNPAVQQNHPSSAKFWCTFNGITAGTNAPLTGYNVTSVTKVGTGIYRINFTVPFTVDRYCPLFFPSANINDGHTFVGYRNDIADSVELLSFNSVGVAIDVTLSSVIGFGLQ